MRTRDYLDPSRFIRNCSAVSGACMMVRKELFEKLGGFDEQLPGTYNDIDFCLRMREAGYRIVWTPEAELYKDEPLARNSEDGKQAEVFRAALGRGFEKRPLLQSEPNSSIRGSRLPYLTEMPVSGRVGNGSSGENDFAGLKPRLRQQIPSQLGESRFFLGITMRASLRPKERNPLSGQFFRRRLPFPSPRTFSETVRSKLSSGVPPCAQAWWSDSRSGS